MSRRRPPLAEARMPAVPTEPPLLLTPEQSFALLQVGRTHGWRLINSGAIPTVRLSPRCIRVPRQALEELIAAGGVQSARATQTGRVENVQPDTQDKGASPSKAAPARDLDLHQPDQRQVSCPPQS